MKPAKANERKIPFEIASITGAWIETVSIGDDVITTQIASITGAWIETNLVEETRHA